MTKCLYLMSRDQFDPVTSRNISAVIFTTEYIIFIRHIHDYTEYNQQ